MIRQSAHASRPPLNAVRIAGTSAAIALHVLVLMLLLTPATWAPPVDPTRDTPALPDFPVIRVVVPDSPPTPKTVDQKKPAIATPSKKPAATQEVADADTGPLVEPVIIGPPDVGKIDPPVGVAAELKTDRAPTPPYPLVALRAGTTGLVLLRISVDAQGHPVSGSIEKSSGSRLLDQSALKFVLAQWHFVPAMQAGSPVNAVALVPIEFALE
jgi:protein TonB